MSYTHELKVWPRYADAIATGVKTFEFRRDDRTSAFHVGDCLYLREWRPSATAENGGAYTGREWRRIVSYIARDGVIPAGYCVLSMTGYSDKATLYEGRTAADVIDYRALLVKYMRHVNEIEGTAFIGGGWGCPVEDILDEAEEAILEQLYAEART